MLLIIIVFAGLLVLGAWAFGSVMGGAVLMAIAGLTWFAWVLNRAMKAEPGDAATVSAKVRDRSAEKRS